MPTVFGSSMSKEKATKKDFLKLNLSSNNLNDIKTINNCNTNHPTLWTIRLVPKKLISIAENK
jgi:hypothetical protein